MFFTSSPGLSAYRLLLINYRSAVAWFVEGAFPDVLWHWLAGAHNSHLTRNTECKVFSIYFTFVANVRS